MSFSWSLHAPVILRRPEEWGFNEPQMGTLRKVDDVCRNLGLLGFFSGIDDVLHEHIPIGELFYRPLYPLEPHHQAL